MTYYILSAVSAHRDSQCCAQNFTKKKVEENEKIHICGFIPGIAWNS